MIMKTIISVPSDHDVITGGELERERRNLLNVLNLGLDIFGFRIFYDMRLLSPVLARERRDLSRTWSHVPNANQYHLHR